MRSRMLPAVLAVLLMLVVQHVWGQEYNCYQCMVYNDCFMCLMFQPSGGISCATPACTSCNLTGVCPAGGGGCFLPGTMVKTVDGHKAIETLEVGDRVVGMDGSERLAACEVVKTHISIQCEYLVINNELRVTGTHPFRVDGRWVEASDIEIGDELQRIDREPIRVTSIDIVRRAVRAYNIEVADAHTFFVEGVLVHNKGPDPGLP